MSDQLLAALLLMTIPLSCIAILLSCISISIFVGLKNSTHKIEWRTYDPGSNSQMEETEEEELHDESMLEEENPNKRIRRNEPFTPFPVEPVKDEEPFFDENDPNNTSHDY